MSSIRPHRSEAAEPRPVVLLSRAQKFDDRNLRIAGSPLLGLLLFYASEFPFHVSVFDHRFILGYAYATGVVFVVWTWLTRFGFDLHSSQWGRKLYHTVWTYVAVSLPVASFSGYLTVSSTASVFGVDSPADGAIRVAVLSALFVAQGLQFYIGVFARADVTFARDRTSQFRTEGKRAQLTSVMYRDDPKSMLSALQAVRDLITVDQQAAVRCAEDLVSVHRYILCETRRDLVLLREELEFLYAHARVLHARFGLAFLLDVAVPAALLDRFLIVPACLHLLLENALLFEHLEPSKNGTVPVTIRIHDNQICLAYPYVSHPLKEGEAKRIASLEFRVRTVMGKGLAMDHGPGQFAVTIPLLALKS